MAYSHFYQDPKMNSFATFSNKEPSLPHGKDPGGDVDLQVMHKAYPRCFSWN